MRLRWWKRTDWNARLTEETAKVRAEFVAAGLDPDEPGPSGAPGLVGAPGVVGPAGVRGS